MGATLYKPAVLRPHAAMVTVPSSEGPIEIHFKLLQTNKKQQARS